jgi:hypothetical protein
MSIPSYVVELHRRCQVLDVSTPSSPLNIISPRGQTLWIKQLHSGQSYKTLGAFVEPFQHQKTHYRHLLKKSKIHTKLLTTSSCKHNHAWVYYFSMFLCSMGYSLPICHFTKSQLETIQQPMTPVILCKLGVCQNFSRMLAFLSSYYGGLHLQALYFEQGI